MRISLSTYVQNSYLREYKHRTSELQVIISESKDAVEIRNFLGEKVKPALSRETSKYSIRIVVTDCAECTYVGGC